MIEIGETYGKLTVLSQEEISGQFLCRCECNQTIYTTEQMLELEIVMDCGGHNILSGIRANVNKKAFQTSKILANKSEALISRAIRLALGGDKMMLKFLISRMVPQASSRPVKFKPPAFKTFSDAQSYIEYILGEVNKGSLTIDESDKIISQATQYFRDREMDELYQRIDQITKKREQQLDEEFFRHD